MISAMVKQSWTSNRCMSSILRPAMARALDAAMWVDSSQVRSWRELSAIVSVACPLPAIRTTGFFIRRAISAGTRMTAAAPSVMGEQSRMRKGSATRTEFTTASTVTLNGNWARGFREPLSWFLTATMASCSRVVP